MIRITSLRKGDVVKLVKSSSYDNEVFHAVVIDMLNGGAKAFIEMLEYKKSYGKIEAQIKLYQGTDDVSIFPTDQKEVKNYFDEALMRLENDIEDDRKKLQEKIDGLAKAREFASGELCKKLTSPDYIEESQTEFDKRLAEKNDQILRLQQTN